MSAGGGMWGGRYEGAGSDELFRAANDSLPIDWRIVQQDIRGSIAWAGALCACGVLTTSEHGQLVDALEALSEEAKAIPHPPVESGAEDVHTWVEQKLVEKLGSLGKKLHTGRSRNDQVATDFRLWTRDAVGEIRRVTVAVARALAEKAEAHHGDAFPAYTHLQPAQPVPFGHWCLAYVEMLERDVLRLDGALSRINISPLGSGALAGTGYAIDREALARELGFASASRNSLDAVSDRDFAIETLSVLSQLAVHLSRLAEDLIVYTSDEFRLVRLDDGVTSGSSLMPQKRNPDSLEVIRGACGSIIGAQVSLLVTMKGLPLAYNKDMQFDKKPVFESVDLALVVLRLSERTIFGMTLNTDRAEERAGAG
ncbi:MAG: argininosuccinate lyase, partial [Phycisphaerales bacterium JB058]